MSSFKEGTHSASCAGTSGRGILPGLEVLIAADIIRTVAVTPTLEGKWPWQKSR